MKDFMLRSVFSYILVFSFCLTSAQAAESGKQREKQAQQIFAKILRVADIPNKAPALEFSPFKESPAAHNNGVIMLPYPIIERCFAQGEQLGESRLAFILSHEIAHLSRRHFRDGETLELIGSRLETKNYKAALEFCRKRSPYLDLEEKISELEREKDPQAHARREKELGLLISRKRQEQELEADRQGVFYMLVAGYDPRSVVTDTSNFISDIYTFLDVRESPAAHHPGADKRAEKFRETAMPVIERFELFAVANRLYQLQGYADAWNLYKNLVEDSSNGFYSKEVFSNMGAAAFQLAMSGDECRKTRQEWMLNVVIDPTLPQMVTKGERRGGTCSQDKDFQEWMPKAITYLEKALFLDPGYLPARTNLMAAQFYSGNHTDALFLAEKLLKSPDNVFAQNVKAVTLFEQNPAQSEPSVTMLQRLMAASPGNPAAIYNLARMYERSGKSDEARKLWQSFIAKNPADPLTVVVQREQKLPVKGAMPRKNLPKPELNLKNLSFKAAEEKLKARVTGRFQEEFGSGSYLQKIEVLYAGDRKLVALDGQVALIESRQIDGERTAKALVEEYGQPERIVPVYNGRVFVYSGFGFEERGGVVERVLWYQEDGGV